MPRSNQPTIAENRKNLSLGETVWYDDAYGKPVQCTVDAIEPGRVWLRMWGLRGRIFFEDHELDRLRSTRSLPDAEVPRG